MLRLKSRTLSAILLLAALVLAGCAGNTTNPTGGSNSTATTPSASDLTPAGAKTLLENAAANVPDKFGMKAAVFSGARQVMTFNASFDNASKTSYVELKGDPAALGASAQSSEEAAALFQNGFSIYSTREGSLYFANGTAFVFPATNESGRGGSLVPDPESSPFGSFLDPEEAIGAFQGSNVNVSKVEATTCRGQAAARITFTSSEEGQDMTAVADVVNTNPPRLCHLETKLPRSENAADPFSNADLRADFYYNEEITLVTPESVSRAIGLLYSSDRPPFSFGGEDEETNITWTFQNSAGIPLGEVEVQVKDTSEAANAESMGISDFGAMPTLWSFKLSEGSKTQDGATLAFTDADGDGKVSKGDTLRITAPSGQPAPTVVMKDLKTGVYVVPGFELVALLGALVGAVLLVRRRA